jgi:signal transduction histidine kinase
LGIGQRVEVRGVSSAGKFAPQVEERERTELGAGQLPPAVPLSFPELASGQYDCMLAEVRGIVRRAQSEGAPAGSVRLWLAMGGGKLHLTVKGARLEDVAWMVDGEVRARGVVAGGFNRQRQLVAPGMELNRLEDVSVELPPPADPFAAGAKRVNALFQYPSGVRPGHRVKISGTVIHSIPSRGLYLRDGERGIWIATRDKRLPAPGTLIEVLGFPVTGHYSPQLEDAVFRVTGHGPPPEPVLADVEQVMSGGLDQNLIRLDATVSQVIVQGTERVGLLQAGKATFKVVLAAGPDFGRTPMQTPILPVGAQVRVTGICHIEEVAPSQVLKWPQSFGILLRTASDIVELQPPPWWNARRLAWALAGLGAVALAVLAWAGLLRWRVRQQTAMIGRQMRAMAVTEERNRIARELHDSLDQEWTGVALQLNALSCRIKEQESRSLLHEARRLLQHCQAEARHAIWQLRQPASLATGLRQSLMESARRMEAAAGPCIHVRGDCPRLDARTEYHLLRIGQEAMLNAVKSSQAREIVVQLTAGPDTISLTVSDDGCGFVPSLSTLTGTDHYGLLGMKERAEHLRGTFECDSHAGQGTRIAVIVPWPPSDADDSPADHAAFAALPAPGGPP